MIQDIAILIGGLAVLVAGGEFLFRGAVGIAKSFRISPLVIGMTVVSFLTSAPELLVSLKSALNDSPGIAIGNVVGSNIANIALVLGLTVIIFPIIPGRQTKRIDWPMLILATILFVLFSFDGVIQLWEGAVLFLILIVFTSLLIVKSRKEVRTNKEPSVIENVQQPVWKSVLFLLLGLAGLYFGCEWLIDGAVNLAFELGMGEHVIALTIVAFGTSAPELVTSAVAAYRKQPDIALGNLVGSNIFNIMAVIGITGMVTPIEVDQDILNFDFWWMVGIAIGLGVMLFLGKKVGRGKGIVLLLTYVAYISILVIKASQ
jgi:cation:H+ antiporter